MKVEKVDRILIAVKEIETASKFFAEAFGVEFDETKVVEEQKARYSRCPIGIELLESTSPDGPIAKFIERRGEGLYALILKVPSIESGIREMEGRGLRLIVKGGTGRLKEAYFHPKDSYGVMIALCEYESKHGATIAESQS